jgi:hypothetical protein
MELAYSRRDLLVWERRDTSLGDVLQFCVEPHLLTTVRNDPSELWRHRGVKRRSFGGGSDKPPTVDAKSEARGSAAARMLGSADARLHPRPLPMPITTF